VFFVLVQCHLSILFLLCILTLWCVKLIFFFFSICSIFSSFLGSLSPAQLITTTASSTLTESTDAHALELENNLLILAATAEQSSDHPLSRAILHAAKERHLKLYALAEDATVMFVGKFFLTPGHLFYCVDFFLQ